jgi:hypothetical protein
MKRVIIGKRNNDFGCWVSRPGFDVDICTEEQMLVSPNILYGRAFLSGQILSLPATNPIDHANGTKSRTYIFQVIHGLGYIPYVVHPRNVMFGNFVFGLMEITNTSVTLGRTILFSASVTPPSELLPSAPFPFTIFRTRAAF